MFIFIFQMKMPFDNSFDFKCIERVMADIDTKCAHALNKSLNGQNMNHRRS